MRGICGCLGRFAQITNVVLTYWIISISMVFTNKHLLGAGGKDKDEDDISIFLAWCQSAVCVIYVLVYTKLGSLFSDSFKVYTIQSEFCLQKPVLLVSFLFSMMLSSNNYTLRYVGIAFFQIARSFTLIFTVVLSALILRRAASFTAALCCLIVVAGFIIGIDQEKVAGTLSLIGVAFGLTASVFVALNGIYTKKAMEIEGMDSVRLTLSVNTNASFLLLIPLFASGQIWTVAASERVYNPWFWGACALSGILGFLIAWASTRQIHYTSPVTHHISNNTKSIFQALLATIIYNEQKSALWWLGCFVVLLGAFLYAYIKLKEDNSNPEATENSNISNDNSIKESV